MNGLYECKISHCRLKPKRHSFSYEVFMISAELGDLPQLSSELTGFSHNRFNLYSIDDRDHIDLGLPGGIRPNLAAWLAGQGTTLADDAKIRLVTFPRVLGYGFNPVSFYYISTAAGEPILAVAEVVNTFREMKLYLISGNEANGLWHSRVPKNFYVSPFSDPGDEFDFQLGLPASEWRVNIDDYDAAGSRNLISSVRGIRRELTSSRLWWYVMKYPLLSLKIIVMIHWHALLLWRKRIPFLRKTQRCEAQTDVMRPHSSLDPKTP